jgi:hypothetical protein
MKESSLKTPESHGPETRKALGLRIVGNDVPAPIRSFEEAGFPGSIFLHHYLLYLLSSEFLTKFLSQFARPSPIQAQGWSVAMAVRSLILLSSAEHSIRGGI